MIEPVKILGRTEALRCTDCTETIELPWRVKQDPEEFTSFIELTALDHVECANYKDAAQALHMRQFRKKKLALAARRGAQDVRQRGTYPPHWR